MRRRHPAYFAAAALVLLTGSGGSCSDEEQTPTTPAQTESLPEAELRLLVVTDLDGYLEPCGCTSRPLGGIDRMAARITALREEGPPTVLVMAGNVFFHGAPHGGDVERARDQEVLRAETLRDVLNRLGVVAATPGPLDFSFGPTRFASLAQQTHAGWLAAGARVEGNEPPVFAASTTVRAGAVTVGVVGFATLVDAAGSMAPGVVVDDPLAAGQAALETLEADVVIALVQGDRRFARRVARLDGVDFVILGGLDEAEARAPSVSGGSAVLHAGRQGQGLTVVDLRRGEGGWSDASEWSRETQRAHLRGRVETLEARIAQWQTNDTTRPADLAAQRARLERFQRELAALEGPAPVRGAYFVASHTELPPEAPRDPAVTRLMRDLDRRINEHNREAFADWEPERVAEGAASYAGSQRCGTCHASAMAWWRGHAHGRAYATLEERDKQFNLSCVGCHVTGYLQPGGSTVTHVEGLTDVGCESCHGPGSLHVQNPSGAAVNVQRAPDERTCVGCHNQEHSDRFQFSAYRQMVIVPGHGAPTAD